MILEITSFNGTSLQSTNYETFIPRANAALQMQTNASYVRRAGAVPVFAGKDFQPFTLQIEVEMQHSFTTLFESLNTLFDTKDETPRQLIATETSDSSTPSKQWYIYATAVSVLGGHDGPMAVVNLSVDDPIWKSVTENSQAVTITAATTTTDFTIGGNDNAYPTFEISATSSPTTDYPYIRHVQVLQRSSYYWTNRFLDLCGTTDGTTFDTAALVTAGKMQADGDDLRVFRDGVEIPRWLSNINTTDTHVIIGEDTWNARDMTLLTALASTDTITEIELNYTAEARQTVKGLPKSGRLIVDTSIGSTDTEEFSYTAINITELKLSFTINSRSLRGTSAFNHAANDNVRFLHHDYSIVYGNATASAPEIDDTKQPIEDLSSRNNSLVYNVFAGISSARRGSWKRAVNIVGDPSLTRSGFYTSTDDVSDTDPAAVIGMDISTYESGGIWRAETAQIGWQKSFGDVISSISCNGAQYQNSASWPAFELRAAGVEGTTPWQNLFTLAAQATTDYSTWTTWTKASSDITVPANMVELSWYVSGTVLGTTDYSAKADIDTLTVGLTNPPHVMLREESTDTKLDLTIANTTTGESLRVIYPSTLNDTLIIDTDPDFPNASYKGQLVNGSVGLSSIRSAWLKFAPGSNSLTFTNNLSATNNMTVTVKWHDRLNFF